MAGDFKDATLKDLANELLRRGYLLTKVDNDLAYMALEQATDRVSCKLTYTEQVLIIPDLVARAMVIDGDAQAAADARGLYLLKGIWAEAQFDILAGDAAYIPDVKPQQGRRVSVRRAKDRQAKVSTERPPP